MPELIKIKRTPGRTPDYLQIPYKRVIQSRPQLLATQLLNGREECLPPNGYSPQSHTTVCPFLTSLWVGQPRLIQPYASCYSLTGSMTFQSKLTLPYGQATHFSVTSVLFKDGQDKPKKTLSDSNRSVKGGTGTEAKPQP